MERADARMGGEANKGLYSLDTTTHANLCGFYRHRHRGNTMTALLAESLGLPAVTCLVGHKVRGVLGDALGSVNAIQGHVRDSVKR